MQNYNDHKIYHYASGNIHYEHYFLNKVLHRIDGPAWIDYYENEKIKREEYYLHGKLHRTNGPARILYDELGQIKSEEYYINGLRLEVECSVNEHSTIN